MDTPALLPAEHARVVGVVATVRREVELGDGQAHLARGEVAAIERVGQLAVEKPAY